MDDGAVRGGFVQQGVSVGWHPTLARDDVLDDQLCCVGHAAPGSRGGVVAVTLDVLTCKRADDMGAMAVIGMPGGVVVVDAGVENQNLSMMCIVQAHGGLAGLTRSMRACFGGGIAEACMVGIDAAVGDTEHYAATVQPDIPQRMRE